MDPSNNPIVRMLKSSKALVMLAMVVSTYVGVIMGKISWDNAEAFLKYIVGAWLLAVGVEDAGKHIAHKKNVPNVPADPTVDAKMTIPAPPQS